MPWTTCLSADEISGLLAHMRLVPAPSSPFSALGPEARPVSLNLLRTKNLLDASGSPVQPLGTAVALLASRERQVRLTFSEGSQWTQVSYVFDASGRCASASQGPKEVSVALAPSADAHQIIVGSAEVWLKSANIPEPQTLQWQCSTNELTAFATVVDAARADQMRNQRQRGVLSTSEIEADELSKALHAGLQSTDDPGLVSLLVGFAPAEFVPNPAELAAGLRRLSERGWIQTRQAGVKLSRDAQRACAAFLNTAPFLAMQSCIGGHIASTWITCRAVGCLCMIDFELNESALLARLTTAGGKVFRQMMLARLRDLTAPAERCAGCGSVFVKTSKFCPECGSQRGASGTMSLYFDPPQAFSRASADRAPAAPQSTPASPAFPAKKVERVVSRTMTVPPVPSVCSRCGEPLAQGHKFCRYCSEAAN